MNPITLTENAVAAAITLRDSNQDWSNLDLRIYLSGKGCDGFDYGVTFDQREEKDVTVTFGAVTVIIDPETVQFVRGSTLEWVDDERGKGFLVENPNHKKFRGKFFRRKGWQERLNGAAPTEETTSGN
ncbi:MAG: hypothetical protein RIQ81_1769 [Pseudomonadota bacterium]|jgi:iron-sulfur cluster insertion protein